MLPASRSRRAPQFPSYGQALEGADITHTQNRRPNWNIQADQAGKTGVPKGGRPQVHKTVQTLEGVPDEDKLACTRATGTGGRFTRAAKRCERIQRR